MFHSVVIDIFRHSPPDDTGPNGGFICLDGDFKEDFVKAIEDKANSDNAPNKPQDGSGCDNYEHKV